MKLSPSKWNQTLESAEIPALPFHLSLVQMLFISAFIFEALMLCLRPLTHFEPHAALRGLVTGPEVQKSRRQKPLFCFGDPLDGGTYGWKESAFPHVFLGQWLLFTTVQWPSRWNAARSKALQADRTQAQNKNVFIPLTPALHTQLQRIERFGCQSHLPGTSLYFFPTSVEGILTITTALRHHQQEMTLSASAEAASQIPA